MIEKHKDAFSPSWQRTLERRVANWKIENGIGKDVSFLQIHQPGGLLAIDCTDPSKLDIRIGSELMDRNFLAFHATLIYSNWESAEHCRSESFEALASGTQNAFHSLRGVTRRLRADEYLSEFQPTDFEMGTDLQRSDNNSGSDRSAGPSQHHPGAERAEHSPGACDKNRDTPPSLHPYKSRDFPSGEIKLSPNTYETVLLIPTF